MNFAETMQELRRVQQEEGEDAFQQAVQKVAMQALRDGNLAELTQAMTSDVLQEYAKATQMEDHSESQSVRQNNLRSTPQMPSDAMNSQEFIEMVRKSMPAMRSQAQFNAFLAGFEALRGAMQNIFAGNDEAATLYEKALHQSVGLARQVTGLTEKVVEAPEAAPSKLGEDFRKAPRQLEEASLQQTLLGELARLPTLEGLTEWWLSNRQRIDEVRSPTLRNPLIDAVRAKKEELTK